MATISRLRHYYFIIILFEGDEGKDKRIQILLSYGKRISVLSKKYCASDKELSLQREKNVVTIFFINFLSSLAQYFCQGFFGR